MQSVTDVLGEREKDGKKKVLPWAPSEMEDIMKTSKYTFS